MFERLCSIMERRISIEREFSSTSAPSGRPLAPATVPAPANELTALLVVCTAPAGDPAARKSTVGGTGTDNDDATAAAGGGGVEARQLARDG